MQCQLTVSLLASLVSSAFGVGTAFAQFTIGFEAPAYTSGAIDGQDGWVQTNANVHHTRVLTASEISAELTAAGLNPADPVRSGDQALLLTSGVEPTGNTGVNRTFAGLEEEERVVVDIWARPLFPGEAGSTVGVNLTNVFLRVQDSAGVNAAGFRFGNNTTGQSDIDYGSSAATAFPWVPSGQQWDPDTWYQITMDLNYVAKTYDFLIDGNKMNEDPIPFYTATSANFSRVQLFVGSNQAGMIVDDLSITAPNGVPLLPGDANRDGRVDGEDFLIWQASFGVQEGAVWDDGDFNGDGRVDGEDFLIWQAHFGQVASSSAVTPEPSALAALVGLAGLLMRRRSA